MRTPDSGPERRKPKIVRVTLLTCPTCYSERLRIYKTIPKTNGAILRYTKCLDCEERFHVIAEVIPYKLER